MDGDDIVIIGAGQNNVTDVPLRIPKNRLMVVEPSALWVSEWGWFGDPASDGRKVVRYAAAEDAHRAGGAWWVWRQACGDPHTLGDGGT